jgi:hypothetical protein
MEALLKDDVIFSERQPFAGETIRVQYQGNIIGYATVSEVKLTDIYQEEKLCGTMVVLELEWSHLGQPTRHSWRQATRSNQEVM